LAMSRHHNTSWSRHRSLHITLVHGTVSHAAFENPLRLSNRSRPDIHLARMERQVTLNLRGCWRAAAVMKPQSPVMRPDI
jgi:hypothetical protein